MRAARGSLVIPVRAGFWHRRVPPAELVSGDAMNRQTLVRVPKISQQARRRPLAQISGKAAISGVPSETNGPTAVRTGDGGSLLRELDGELMEREVSRYVPSRANTLQVVPEPTVAALVNLPGGFLGSRPRTIAGQQPDNRFALVVRS